MKSSIRRSQLLLVMLLVCTHSLLSFATLPRSANGQTLDPAASRDSIVGSPALVAHPPPKRVAVALMEAIGINILVNLFDRATSPESEVFDVTPESWARNLREGWEWDDNKFKTNQFEHPYHGSTYFNAGRANGLGFWESASLAMIGSLTWEYFGETTRPSLNDFINTTVGGMALGEMFHRSATLVRDNQAKGNERIALETAGFAIDPIGGFNRTVRGESVQRGPNPAIHDAPHVGIVLRAGLLERESDPNGGFDGEAGGFAEFVLSYGDPIQSDLRQPFDVFRLRVEGGLVDTARINRFQGEGLLYGKRLRWSDSVIHRLMIQQRFDYVTNNSYEFGGQSVEARVVSRFTLGHRHRITTSVGALGTLLGAINSERVGLAVRDYDFGPGLGLQLGLQWDRGGLTYARWDYLTWVIPTLAGTDATHLVHIGGIEGQAHIGGRLAVGANASYFRRDSYHHPDEISFHQDTPEFRLYLAWTP